jgi:hypothetical protein
MTDCAGNGHSKLFLIVWFTEHLQFTKHIEYNPVLLHDTNSGIHANVPDSGFPLLLSSIECVTTLVPPFGAGQVTRKQSTGDAPDRPLSASGPGGFVTQPPRRAPSKLVLRRTDPLPRAAITGLWDQLTQARLPRGTHG